ncbi:ABSCISIC ACID-INSENSITIVE 5-like protein 5 isoform X1 [Vigna umbellata]|uniref:ABSCISIC ACID-INSENSITIVE 5-like protein 5 isoform X1 n=1 Tax=Vigna umbellata TaxID=87088 RepID=UPI001F5F2D59|nr:ABSCISIC ACID-INSENSITIVE 5-like protein 5 isoform X1 [Vigna umbellata]XP_047161193.1 ABSCISIC ACID-INSENSITIVE 5-like protein 5 isoform X1 [Vigna umbellata]
MNFKSFGNEAGGDGGGRPVGNFSLTRQPSVYSLTFDEFMNSMGGSGKDFGSMNMDELLKNIWTAEEVQTMASAGVATEDVGAGVSHLQRQGSLTLPRTLSQKTVDEVWKDISKDYGGHGGPNLAQTPRQPTLGEMTLEEFLVRAGVVREDAKPNDGVFMDLARAGNNNGLGFGFQQMNKVSTATGLMGNRLNNDPLVGLQSSANLPLSVNGVRSSSQQPQMQSPQSQQQHQQQIFPKQSPMSYAAAQMPQGMVRGGIVGLGGDQGLSVQGGGIGRVGLAPGSVHVTTGSPAANQISGDKMTKSNGDTSSVSPVPYVFNGGMRGRKTGGAVEKVIERRQRRMIKNRESAARSRARKQTVDFTLNIRKEGGVAVTFFMKIRHIIFYNRVSECSVLKSKEYNDDMRHVISLLIVILLGH